MTPLSETAIKQLQQYDSSTICNVMELCNFRPRSSGQLNPAIQAIYPQLPPMVGYAVTGTFRSSQPASPGEASLSLFGYKQVFDAIPFPRVMVIQDLDDPSCGAVYGEIMARVFQAFGCAGLVTNGFARDILQVEDIKFPCFATGVSVSHANSRLMSLGDTLQIGGVTIEPGALIHGDANGVTTIPHAIANDVANACADYVATEEVLIHAVQEGLLSPEQSAPAVEEFKKRMDVLSQRLSGCGADHDVGV